LRIRVPGRALAALLLALIAVGVASPSFGFDLRSLWPFGHKEAAAPVPDPTPYRIDLQVTGGDSRLAKKLRGASVLVSERKTPPSGIVGLLARARQDVARLTAVLYEDARYAGEIVATIAGRPLDGISPFDPIGVRPVPVIVRIAPGPQFLFGRIDVRTLPPDVTLDDLDLVPGKPAGSAKIIAAEAAVADAWRDLGHPLVRVGERNVSADHRRLTLDVGLNIVPGPSANFGRVAIVGTDRVNPLLVQRRAGLDGRLYRLKTTRSAEARLRDLGVFDSVRVTPGDHLDPDGTIPVVIDVSERKRRVIGGSVSYSNVEGAGLGAYWMHRNLFGGAEQLRLSLDVSRILDTAFANADYRLAARFQKPAVLGPMTDFTFQTETYRQTTDSYRVTAVDGEAGLTRKFSDTLTGGLGLKVERSWVRDAGLETDHLLTTLTSTLEWDTRDNRFDPSSGFRAMLKAAGTYDFLQKQAFGTFRGDYSIYRALDRSRRFVVAARVSAAVLTTGDVLDVPADLRLYAGGAGSVRGYAYRNIGPRDPSDVLIGGRSLFEVSTELRYRINDQFGLAAFIDGGNAFASMVPNPAKLKFGVGLGLRYLTPVGPLRLDVAVPLKPGPDDPRFAVYVGLGQAF
jgi:translocation and assembly module TamA